MAEKNNLRQEPHITAAEEMYKIIASAHPECILTHHMIEKVSRIDVPGKALDVKTYEKVADQIANRYGIRSKLMINFLKRNWNSSIIFGNNLDKPKG